MKRTQLIPRLRRRCPIGSWAIPYIDQDLSFWQEIARRFGPAIQEVYCPLPGGLVASGRGRQPERFLEAFLRAAPLPKAVLLNPILLSRPVEEVSPDAIQALRWLHEEFGVARATVTSLALAQRIRDALPEFHLAASVLMGIVAPAQVAMIQGTFDALTPGNTLLRDLAGLRRLRAAFPGEIRPIVNEACLPGCPYRTQHFYEMAYVEGFPPSLCGPLLDAQPWLRLTGAWVLPRHLHHYDGLYDSLKLAGRVTLRDPARYLTVLDAYVHRQDILPRDIGGGPASLLEPIDMPDDLYETILHCDKNCVACSICRDYYEQATARRRS